MQILFPLIPAYMQFEVSVVFGHADAFAFVTKCIRMLSAWAANIFILAVLLHSNHYVYMAFADCLFFICHAQLFCICKANDERLKWPKTKAKSLSCLQTFSAYFCLFQLYRLSSLFLSLPYSYDVKRMNVWCYGNFISDILLHKCLFIYFARKIYI